MHYFTTFPLVQYDPNNEDHPQLAVDITRRFKISDVLKNNRIVYYEYDIQDHDRADAMAERYYGDSRLDWLLFVVNQMYDPYFQWPLNYSQFDAYIRQKYGSPSIAMATTHHYEQIITTRKEYYSNYDNTVIMIPEQTLVVDYTTYLSLGTSLRKVITTFDYEEDLNNKKRTIKIMDKALNFWLK